MNVIVRPQFYLDIEEEVDWLLANADAGVAQRWHEAVWQTLELLTAHPAFRTRTQGPQAAGDSLMAGQTLSAMAGFLYFAR